MEDLLQKVTNKKSLKNDGPGYCYVVVRYSPGNPLPNHLIETLPGFHRGPPKFEAHDGDNGGDDDEDDDDDDHKGHGSISSARISNGYQTDSTNI